MTPAHRAAGLAKMAIALCNDCHPARSKPGEWPLIMHPNDKIAWTRAAAAALAAWEGHCAETQKSPGG